MTSCPPPCAFPSGEGGQEINEEVIIKIELEGFATCKN